MSDNFHSKDCSTRHGSNECNCGYVKPLTKEQREIKEILTKVYGYLNRMKMELTFKKYHRVWKLINELSDYVTSFDLAAALEQKP